MELIVAVYDDWGIGANGTQPVALSADRKFFREMTRGCMVIAGALPIHEDEQGVGGDLYKLFSIGVILFSQALAALTHPLSMLSWLPFCAYAASCIIRAKEWPSWRLWAGITAYFTIIFSIFCS